MQEIRNQIFRIIGFIGRITQTSKQAPSLPYITGDAFRRLAQHAYDQEQTFDPTSVKEKNIVFVSSTLLDIFFTTIHPKIQFPYILITHNGDRNISAKEVSYIDSKIIHWFAQNILIEHPKITSIPIGLENKSYYLHGIPWIFNHFKKSNVAKEPKILFGFNPNTNRVERLPAQTILRNCPTAQELPQRINPYDYVKTLNHFSFVASPPGNGSDCHRTWEALYLKTIPIVKRSKNMEYFQSLGLPIWIIDDWQELLSCDEPMLQTKYTDMMNTARFEALDFTFWQRKISSL